MNHPRLRREIIDTARLFNGTGLSTGTSGNISARTRDGYLITPTGVAYDDLKPGSLIELDLDGTRLKGDLKQSSEWSIHADVYRARPEVTAVVHVHSPYATGLACTRQGIPGFHYEVAMAGGDSIRCAEYATFGTKALARNALGALDGRMACLLANHGQIALGASVPAALAMAVKVETLARQYCLARQCGEPVLLGEEEMRVNVEKFRAYGKQED